MPQINDLVNGLGEGWKVVGTGMPIEEVQSTANPAAGDLAPAGTPSRIQQGTGRYYVVVQDAEGHQRALYLKASPIKGGLEVPVTGQPLPPGSTAFTGDLRTLDWTQAGAVADVPAGAKQPSPTSKLDQVLDPNTNKVIGLRDPATGNNITLPTDPAGTLHEMGDDLLLIKPDGSYTVVTSKAAKPTTQSIPNIGLVEYDPSKPAGQRTTVLIAAPKDPNAQPTLQTVNGKTYVFNKDSGEFVASNLPPDASVGYTFNDPNSKWITFYDKQGNEISRTEKPDWKAEPKFQAGQAGTADLVAARIPTINPQTGALEFVDNQAQVKASDATSQLAQQLGLQVAAGSMSEKQAQDLITNAINALNAQSSQQTTGTQAATGALTALGQGAQTGAGMLQNRVSNAQQMLQGILGVAGQGQRSGNMGGGLMNAPAGLGEALVGGIQGWTTELGGGQGVYDTAARLVQQADPTNSPQAQAAYGVLTQMLDKYKQTTGQDHPAVAATNALSSSTAANGLTAPALQGMWSQPGTQAQLAQQSAAGSQLPRSPMMAPGGGMAAVMPQALPQPVTTDTFVAPQMGMASLFVPGNPFVAPPLVRPTVVT